MYLFTLSLLPNLKTNARTDRLCLDSSQVVISNYEGEVFDKFGTEGICLKITR